MHPARSLYLGLFALGASLGSVFTLLAAIQDEFGFGHTTLGLIAGSAFFSSVGSQLWLAPLADRGRAKQLAVGAVVLAVVAALWFVVADSVVELVLARVLAGVAVGAFQPTARAVMSSLDPDRVGERLGYLSAVEMAGIVGGPVLAAGLYEVWGLDAPFLFLAVLLAATLPGLVRAEFPPIEQRDQVSRLEVAKRIAGRRSALAAVCIGAALYLPVGMYEAIWARFLSDLGASTLFIGLSLTMYGLPFVMSAAVSGRFIDRYGPWPATAVALVVIVPLTVLYGQLRSVWLLVGFALVEATGNGAGLPASQAAMVAATNEGERAAGQGLVAAASQVGAGLAAFIAAPLYAGVGPGPAFAVVAGMVALVGGTGLWLGRPSPAGRRSRTRLGGPGRRLGRPHCRRHVPRL